MSHSSDDQSFPRGPLIGAGALVLFSLVAVAALRVSGAAPVAPERAPVAVERHLRFEDVNGGVDVIDARSGRAIASLQQGGDGFVRATLRTFVRERRRQNIGAEMPFVLASHVDGRLSLDDPATGRSVYLEAFGPDNAAAFARLLKAQPQT
jgi:putative photosynthetic complex assembly protein